MLIILVVCVLQLLLTNRDAMITTSAAIDMTTSLSTASYHYIRAK